MMVHIVHADDTEGFADRVLNHLLQTGIQVAVRDGPPISECDAVIVIMTPAAEFDDHVDAGIEQAVSAGVSVLPVLRRGRPLLALAGLPLEHMTDPYGHHRDSLPSTFLTRLTQAAAVPVDGWLPAQNRAELRGRLAAAIADPALWRRFVIDAQCELGWYHPTTLECRAHALRASLLDADALAGAWQRLVEDQTIVFGPDHEVTMLGRHNLAEVDIDSSQARDGTVLRLRALCRDEFRLFGDDHWRPYWTHGQLDDLDR